MPRFLNRDYLQEWHKNNEDFARTLSLWVPKLDRWGTQIEENCAARAELMSLLEPLGPQIESDDILSSLRFLSSKAQLLPIDMAVETENATRTSVVSPKAQPKAHQLDSMLDQPVLVNVFEGEETGSAMKGFECIPLRSCSRPPVIQSRKYRRSVS